MKNRTCLITGASAGIGVAFAHAYGARGANLVLVARRLDRLNALAETLRQTYGIAVTTYACDLGLPAAVEQLIGDLSHDGHRIDILVNNAGFSIAKTFMATEWHDQSGFVEVCVTTPTRLCHAFLPHMKAQKFGRIVNLSSIAAFSGGSGGHTLYPAAKSYMLKMSRSLAAEVAQFGIKVTAVCPGSTESEFFHANGLDTVVKGRSMPFVMSAKSVVDIALKANETGREVVIPGLINRFLVTLMQIIPDPIITPLIRAGAKNFTLE
jgi:hypothetical protein